MEDKILEVMRRVFQNEDVDTSCSQVNCEQWDSMNHLNLIVELELEFDTSFEPEEIGEMTTFAKVLAVVQEKLQGKNDILFR